tara:strand:- start:73 stop:549 length:477 start_codon:yes stop_codon:yes gene_type:complete
MPRNYAISRLEYIDSIKKKLAKDLEKIETINTKINKKIRNNIYGIETDNLSIADPQKWYNETTSQMHRLLKQVETIAIRSATISSNGIWKFGNNPTKEFNEIVSLWRKIIEYYNIIFATKLEDINAHVAPTYSYSKSSSGYGKSKKRRTKKARKTRKR